MPVCPTGACELFPLLLPVTIARILFVMVVLAACLRGQTINPNPSKEYIRLGGRILAIENPENISKPAIPAGPASGTQGVSYTYTASGSASSWNNPVQYELNWGDGTNSGWLASGTTAASHSWATAGTYLVTAQARSATNTSVLSALSSSFTVIINPTEAVSTPNTPSGTTSGITSTTYTYTSSGATDNLGNAVQYLFNWGDGTNSGWLATGVASASHSWAVANTYAVTAQARSATNTSVVSAVSAGLSVLIRVPEAVTAPSTPSGTASGVAGTSYSYTTGGSTDNWGSPVQYLFNWGDGTNSGWLGVGGTSASHTWAAPGSFSVTAQARSSA